MADVIETIQDDPQASSTVEGEAAQIFKTRAVKSRPAEPKRKPLPRRTLALLAAALAAVAGISWWLHARHFELTSSSPCHIHLLSKGLCRHINRRPDARDGCRATEHV